MIEIEGLPETKINMNLNNTATKAIFNAANKRVK
mgnify:FL=1